MRRTNIGLIGPLLAGIYSTTPICGYIGSPLADALGGPSYVNDLDNEQGRKCRLKDCQRTTTHNGGFCCAEHKYKQDAIDKKKGNK